MKKTNKLSKMAGLAKITLRKNAPTIGTVLGIGGIITGTVLACIATKKLDDVLAEKDEVLEKIDAGVDNEAISTKEARELVVKTYLRTGLNVGKLYLPAFLVTGASITSILISHHVMKERYANMAAAYTTAITSFKEYRKRVVDKYGAEVDKELRFAPTIKKVMKEVIDPETGEVKTIEEEIEEPSVISDENSCLVLFDESNPNWNKTKGYNLSFLKEQEKWANIKLQSRKYLFLNDVLGMIGAPLQVPFGWTVGWVYDPDNPRSDCYVDFGMYNKEYPENVDFVMGEERSVWLDFNVDGDITHRKLHNVIMK